MGTTPPTHASAVRFMNFGAETNVNKPEKQKNLFPGPAQLPRSESAWAQGNEKPTWHECFFFIAARLKGGREPCTFKVDKPRIQVD